MQTFLLKKIICQIVFNYDKYTQKYTNIKIWSIKKIILMQAK